MIWIGSNCKHPSRFGFADFIVPTIWFHCSVIFCPSFSGAGVSGIGSVDSSLPSGIIGWLFLLFAFVSLCLGTIFFWHICHYERCPAHGQNGLVRPFSYCICFAVSRYGFFELDPLLYFDLEVLVPEFTSPGGPDLLDSILGICDLF